MSIWQPQSATPPLSNGPSSPGSLALDWITKLACEALGAPLALLIEQSFETCETRLLAAHGVPRRTALRMPETLPEWLFHSAGVSSREVAQGQLAGGFYACVPVGRPGSGYRAVLCVADNTSRPGGISATERESLLVLVRLAWQQISNGRLNLDLNAMTSGDEHSIIRRAAIERLRFAMRDTAPAELCAA